MRIRLFLALNFSVAVTRRLVEEMARRKAAVAGTSAKVAWVPAANLHLTLKFLGATPEEAIDAIQGRLTRLAAAHAPFEARVRGLGAFPSLAAPRVLWCGVDAGEPLARLQRDVEQAMIELGFTKEERAFHPHVTVGRVQEPADLSALFSGEAELGASPLSEIVVYESKTLAKGAEYRARARVPLGKLRT